MRYITRYYGPNRVAEVWQHDDGKGYTVKRKLYDAWIEPLALDNVTVSKLVDIVETWCEGCVDPWL